LVTRLVSMPATFIKGGARCQPAAC
jgi:hypothetical protein